VKAVSVEWFKNLAEGDQEKFKELLKSSHRVLGRQKQILEQRLVDLEIKEVAEAAYENPAWAYKQAHLNGRRAEIHSLLKLLDFLED
jgi:predicted sugar kinase